jgi:hypothetical protein
MLKVRSLFGICTPWKSSRSSELWRHFLVLHLIVFFFAVSISTALAASGNGPVGYWNSDEGVGATAADFSGNNKHQRAD